MDGIPGRGARLLAEQDSVLLVIDIQPQLSDAMPPTLVERMIRQTRLLSRTAGLIGIPVIATQQYPRGLGPLSKDILDALPASSAVIEKTCFSCQQSEAVRSAIERTGRNQILLVGIEAHVCVLQTAFDLARSGFDVQVAEDAVCSRMDSNMQNALSRMRGAGIAVTNAESAVFEWLRDARHAHFKAVSALLR